MKITTRILVALGAAEALMMADWARVFDAGLPYFYANRPTGMVIATYALMVVLAAIAFACTFLPAKARWLLIPVAVFMLDNVRMGLALHWALFPVLVVGGLVAVRRLVKQEKTTWLKAGTLTFELLGFVGIATMLAGMTLFRDPGHDRRSFVQSIPSKPRIVLAIFDELDPVHALEQWPKDRPENEFQRFSKRSLSFVNCAQPGPETLYSIPAMTIGHKVDLAKAASGKVLNLIVGGKKREWAEKPNIIVEAREQGQDTSVFGWYHPYDRLYPGVTADTYQRIPDSFDISFWIQVNFLFEHPFRLVKINTQSPMLNAAYAKYQKQMVLDYRSKVLPFLHLHDGLIILHIPCPHGPYVMDPVPGDVLGTSPESYYGNVEYAGQMLADIEKKLKSEPQPYTLIVTSDHNLRISLNGIKPCGRVPMMISGTTLSQPAAVSQPAFGENVANVIRLLLRNPNAPRAEIISRMTSLGR